MNQDKLNNVAEKVQDDLDFYTRQALAYARDLRREIERIEEALEKGQRVDAPSPSRVANLGEALQNRENAARTLKMIEYVNRKDDAEDGE